MTGVRVEVGRRLQVHRPSPIIEGHDESLERAATDVPIVVAVAHCPLLGGAEAGDRSGHLDRTKLHRACAYKIGACGTSYAPTLGRLDPVGIGRFEILTLNVRTGHGHVGPRSRVDVETGRPPIE